jgi:aspartate/methionine/tyrosine aminotransferase
VLALLIVEADSMLDISRPAPADILSALKLSVAAEPASGIVDIFNYAQGRPDVIPLWVGQGHLPTPDFIAEAAIASLRAGETFYTWQRGIPELREALARYHHRLYGIEFDHENFYVCQAGMQSVQLAIQALLEPGDEVVVPSPAWPNYAAPLRMAQVRPVEVTMEFDGDHWRLDLERLFASVTAKTKVLLMNTPSNPLGRIMTREEIVAVRDFARDRGLWIIADEVYARFYFPSDCRNDALPPSFLQFCDPDERIIFCNTFSKNWAMTGWRVGWMIAPKAMGQVVENLVQYNTSGTTTFLQKGCLVALEHGESFLASQVEQARQGRDIVCQALRSSPHIRFAEPEGAFYLFFRIAGTDDSASLARRLIDEAGVGCAPGSAFGPGGEGFLRLCFARKREHLEKAADRLLSWLGKR